MPAFKTAVRRRAKLRMSLEGPSKAGKTYTALRLAFGIAKRVAVIDSEHGTASLYQGLAPDGVPFNFDVLELDSFAPTEYTAAIEEAGRRGYEAIVIDSLSHAWNGKDGALEIVNRSPANNKYTAWKEVTPMHNRMIEAIQSSPCHVFATMRSKMEHTLEKNDEGKMVPRKVGMAPIQRDGMEYEFTICGAIDASHVMTVYGSRCPAVEGMTVLKPGAAFLAPVMEWLNNGEAYTPPPVQSTFATDGQIQQIVSLIAKLGRSLEKEKEGIFKRYKVQQLHLLTPDQAADLVKRLEIDAKKKFPAEAANQAAAQVDAPSSAVKEVQAVQPPAEPAQALQESLAEAAQDDPEPPVVVNTPTLAQLQALIERKAELFHLSDVGDPKDIERAWGNILAKRGVKHDKELTEAQAGELIANLEGRINQLHEKEGRDHPFPVPA